jgi:hypothetical protein
VSREDPISVEVLEHYSSGPLVRVRSARQASVNNPDLWRGKPNGLWVSVKGEDDWPSWCEAEDFGRGPVCHRIALRPDANILRVRGVRQIDAFDRRYAIDAKLYPDSRFSKHLIDWNAVARDFDGILIAPYVWERRLDRKVSDWYYGWDCASGVIWKSRAVAKIEPIEPNPTPGLT